MSEKYESKAIVTTITATSRQSTKIHDNFYTIEFTEERSIPQVDGVDLAKEKVLLWDEVNTECDNQIADIQEMWRQYDEEVKRKIAHN